MLRFEDARWLRTVARRLVGPEDADDLVQETWLRLVRAPLADGVPVGPWLVRVAKNLAASDRRKQATRRRAHFDIDSPPSPEALVDHIRAERRLIRLVANLPEPYLTTLLLRYGEGLTSEGIGTRMGVPPGTVRWRVMRALATLRSEMAAPALNASRPRPPAGWPR